MVTVGVPNPLILQVSSFCSRGEHWIWEPYWLWVDISCPFFLLHIDKSWNIDSWSLCENLTDFSEFSLENLFLTVDFMKLDDYMIWEFDDDSADGFDETCIETLDDLN